MGARMNSGVVTSHNKKNLASESLVKHDTLELGLEPVNVMRIGELSTQLVARMYGYRD